MDHRLSFETAFKIMGATQQLATRSLINLIEMVSTNSHRLASENTAFTEEALGLMQEASQTRDPEALRKLQKRWAETCLKYGQNQTRTTMNFVEHCGLQALSVASNPNFSNAPQEEKAPPSSETPS